MQFRDNGNPTNWLGAIEEYRNGQTAETNILMSSSSSAKQNDREPQDRHLILENWPYTYTKSLQHAGILDQDIGSQFKN